MSEVEKLRDKPTEAVLKLHFLADHQSTACQSPAHPMTGRLPGLLAEAQPLRWDRGSQEMDGARAWGIHGCQAECVLEPLSP